MNVSKLMRPAERLTTTLADPRWRESSAVIVIIGYVVLWTLYGALAKASQDIHFDMAELVAWAREPALGYPKHPPLAAWLVRGWFAVFPVADWSYYLLAMTVVGVALWIAWRLFAPYLDGDRRVVALALLTFIPFYNFHALKLNPNTVLLPLWAVTTLWFIRSYETRSVIYAALAGLGAAGCMLGKYWSIFFLAGLGVAALIDPRRADYFRSRAPWVTIAVGAVAFAPHVMWLVANRFSPFTYALEVHATGTFGTIAMSALGYLGGAVGYVAVPILVALAAMRPGFRAMFEILKPRSPDRRFAALSFWMPFLLPAAVAPVLGVTINSLWTMAGWSLLPVVLLSSPRTRVSHAAAVRIVACAVAVPVVLVIAAPFVALAIQRSGVPPVAAHGSLLAARVTQAWRQATNEPLRVVGGPAYLAYAVAFYSSDKPSTFPELDARAAPWIDRQKLVRSGIAMVCPESEPSCLQVIEAFAGVGGRRTETELARTYMGVAGAPARYVIVIVPPQTE